MVAEANWLCSLKMSKARHNRARLLLGDTKQGRLKPRNQFRDLIDLAAHIQTNISSNLIISRSTRVQFFAYVTDAGG
jgi:hypothetical protein